MKASHWTASLAAGMAFAASGICIAADVGIMDGQDAFTNFHSTKTRAQVYQEYLDARAQGLLPQNGNIESADSGTSAMDIGARGPAGSRYQSRTREEVIDELREYKRTHNPNDPNDIYFGG